MKKQLCDWFELDFQFQRWLHQAWPFGLLAWLLSRRVPQDKGCGRFDDKRDVLYLPADHLIFDPKNDHLCTKKAAHKSFEHLKTDADDGNRTDEHGKCISPYGNTLPSFCRLGDSEIEPLTPEQHVVVANAEPLQQGTVVQSLLPTEILKAEERHRA